MFLTSIGEYDRKRLIQCGSLTLALAELWKMTALCSPSLHWSYTTKVFLHNQYEQEE